MFNSMIKVDIHYKEPLVGKYICFNQCVEEIYKVNDIKLMYDKLYSLGCSILWCNNYTCGCGKSRAYPVGEFYILTDEEVKAFISKYNEMQSSMIKDFSNESI